MGLRDRLRFRPTGSVVTAELVESDSTALLPLAGAGADVERVARELRGAAEYVQEAYTQAQLALEDAGWTKITANGEQAITRAGLRSATSVARVMARANPLIRRGLALRAAYVWGEGVNITARAGSGGTDNPSEQDVNTVVQDTIDDEGNQRAWFGEQAREEHERAVGTDGNVFVVLFTEPSTGVVRVRTLPWDEIEDVITNPEDRTEPWFYLRAFTAPTTDALGAVTGRARLQVLYPHVDHRPGTRVKQVQLRDQLVQVRWDAPVVPLHVNRLDGDTFGIGDVYTALAPARAYIEFVQDWAQLMKALARFAWRRTGGNTRTQKAAAQVAGAAAAAEAEASRLTRGTGSRAGALADLADGQTLEAVPKSGATIDAESARPLGALVAAGMDLPVTMVLADPGISGARATAETLDKPNELLMGARQRRWAQMDRRILAYVITESVRAPGGSLVGTITRTPFGRERVLLAGDTDPTVDVAFPPLEKVDPVSRLGALKIAADIVGAGSLDIVRLVLEAVGVEDVDAAIDDLTDENGKLVDASVQAGVDAVAAHLAGLDAASSEVYGTGGAKPPADQQQPPAKAAS